jgi:hypothetical protein
LSIVKFLGLLEVEEIQMVGIDLDLVQRPVKIVTPFSKGMDNAEEFVVVNFVLSFSGTKGFREEEHWVALPSQIHLCKNCS